MAPLPLPEQPRFNPEPRACLSGTRFEGSAKGARPEYLTAAGPTRADALLRQRPSLAPSARSLNPAHPPARSLLSNDAANPPPLALLMEEQLFGTRSLGRREEWNRHPSECSAGAGQIFEGRRRASSAQVGF